MELSDNLEMNPSGMEDSVDICANQNGGGSLNVEQNAESSAREAFSAPSEASQDIPIIKKSKKRRNLVSKSNLVSTKTHRAKKLDSMRNEDVVQTFTSAVASEGLENGEDEPVSVVKDSTHSHKEVIEIDDDNHVTLGDTATLGSPQLHATVSRQHTHLTQQDTSSSSASNIFQELMSFNSNRVMTSQQVSTTDNFIPLSASNTTASNSTRPSEVTAVSDQDSDEMDDSGDLLKNTEEEYQFGSIQFGEAQKRKTSEERVLWSRKYEDIDTEIDLDAEEPDERVQIHSQNDNRTLKPKSWEFEQMKNGGISLNKPPKPKTETIFGEDVIDLTGDDNDTQITVKSKKRKTMDTLLSTSDQMPPEFALPQSSIQTYQQVRDSMMAHLQSVRDTNDVYRTQLQNLKLNNSEQGSLSTLRMTLKHKSEEYDFYKEIRAYSKELLECYDYIVPKIDQCAQELSRLREDVLDRESFEVWNRSIQNTYQKALKEYGLDLPQVRHSAEGRAFGVLPTTALEDNSLMNGEIPPSLQVHNSGPVESYKTSEAFKKYNEKRHQSLSKIKHLFDDIEKDFTKTARICTEFEKWKRRFPKSYLNSYMSLSLRKILTPYIRMQLLNWNPLTDHDFSKYEFFDALEDYGNVPLPVELQQSGESMSDEAESGEQNQDMDPRILEDLIHDTTMPNLLHFVRHEYDPLSAHDSVQLKSLIKNNTQYFVFKEEGKPYTLWGELCQCLVDRIRKCVNSLLDVDPLLIQEAEEQHLAQESNSTTNALHTFIQMQLNLSAAILESSWSWVSDGFFTPNMLKDLILDILIKRKILPVIRCIQDLNERSKLFDRVQHAVELPEEWTQEIARVWDR